MTTDDAIVDAPVQLESLCMRCGENGITTVLLKSIPHYRQILISAFECSNCNERNNEVQFAGELQPQGCRFTLHICKGDMKMMNRQVVKSDSATIKIPELEFEIPPQAQRGVLSTVEGVLAKAAEGLEALQEERWKVDPETAEKLSEFIVKLREHASGEHDFTFILDDPSGNSFMENPNAPEKDPTLSLEFYERTPEQQEALGFLAPKQSSENEGSSQEHTGRLPHGTVGAELAYKAIAKGESDQVFSSLVKYSAPEEVMTFPATCGACDAACETRMYMTNIPYFKEVIVMASSCDICGYKDSELKPGGSFSDKGKKISVSVRHPADLCRDVIKSTTSTVVIPEVELELGPGTLGGVVTTVEGLVVKISEQLKNLRFFQIGDSAEPEARDRWKEFDSKLTRLTSLEEPWTLILDDPLSNSFIAPSTDTLVENDDQLTVEEYERTEEQDEELGLKDAQESNEQ